MVKRKSIRLSRSPASVLPLTGKGKRRGPPPRPRSSWARPRSWDPDADLSQIIAVRRETGGWPRRTGEHSSLYRRINAARSGLYPELAQLLNDACPGWRDDAFPRTKQRAINTAIVQGRSPASTDTDENLPLRDHDRAQIEELVGNFIAQIVIIIHNLRPSNGGFTSEAPRGTQKYVKANGNVSTYIEPDQAAYLEVGGHEIDEGGYQPHDSKSYHEKDEISRAFQLLNVPPLAAFPGDYTSSSSVMWRYGSLNTGYLTNDEFRLAKGPLDNQDKLGRWREKKIEWANTLCRDKAKMDRKKIEDMEYASMLLRGVLLYLIHPDTRDMYEDGGERFPTAVHSKDQPTIELFKDVLHIKGVQGMARALMELMPHITNKQDGDSWLALINYHADAKHAPGKEFMDESRSKMTATSDTPTIFFYPNPCKQGGALDLKARGYDIPQKRPMKAAAVGKKNKWPRKAAAAGFFKKKNEATKRSAPISPETHGQMLITNFLTRM